MEEVEDVTDSGVIPGSEDGILMMAQLLWLKLSRVPIAAVSIVSSSEQQATCWTDQLTNLGRVKYA